MVYRKLGNVGNVGILGIFFRVFFVRVFDFEYWAEIDKSEEKKSEKIFLGFRVFGLTDTTPCVCDSNLKSVLGKLEQNSELAIAWFEMNYMKLNTDKCRLLISRNKNEFIGQDWIKI